MRRPTSQDNASESMEGSSSKLSLRLKTAGKRIWAPNSTKSIYPVEQISVVVLVVLSELLSYLVGRVKREY